jgi:pimeloyl-ACP methyl ester carboxylesterase
MPALIVWGERDNIIPVSHAHAAHEAMAGSRLEIMEGTGHFCHVEDPRRFVEILTDFMQTTEPASVTTEQWRQLMLAHTPSPS